MVNWRHSARYLVLLPSDNRRGSAHGGRGGEARIGRRTSDFLAPPYSTSAWRRSGACLHAWSLDNQQRPLWLRQVRRVAANTTGKMLLTLNGAIAALARFQKKHVTAYVLGRAGARTAI